jgi:probable F420-dependent oxidoreductase
MKIGISTAALNESTLTPIDYGRLAESLGFESAFIGEHPIIPVKTETPYIHTGDENVPDLYKHFSDPFICLSMMAAVTTRLKIGIAVCLVPEHNPIHLSKLVAALDLFSRGRFLFGVGSGWLKEASQIMGVTFEHRWRQTEEYLRVLQILWSEPQASFSGEFFNLPPVYCYPKPMTKPHPPILMGAGGPNLKNLPALRRTVRFANGWFPMPGMTLDEISSCVATLREFCAEAGRDFDAIEITIPIEAQSLVESDDPGEVRKLIESYSAAGVHRLVPFFFELPKYGAGEALLSQAARLFGLR